MRRATLTNKTPRLYPGRVVAHINSPVHFIGRGVNKNSRATHSVSVGVSQLFAFLAPHPPRRSALRMRPASFLASFVKGESRDEDAQRLGCVAPLHLVKATRLTGRGRRHTHARDARYPRLRTRTSARVDEGLNKAQPGRHGDEEIHLGDGARSPELRRRVRDGVDDGQR